MLLLLLLLMMMLMLMMMMCCLEGKSGFYGSSLESTFERQSCITGKCPTVNLFHYLLS